MKQEDHAHTDAPRLHRITVNGLALAVHEWPGSGEPIMLAHATGFHSQCWREVIRHLPGRHIFAMDMPSHGASARKQPPYDPTGFGNYLGDVIQALDLNAVLGVGHSMGGHMMVLAASRLPARFRGLVLIDPVIVDPSVSRVVPDGVPTAELPVARRRDEWQSWQAMVEHFRDRTPYATWEPAVLSDYCRFGLVPASQGEGFELACPPLLEASVYAGMHMRDVYAAVARVHIPVNIIRARSREAHESRFDFSPSPTWDALVNYFSNATDLQLTDRSHFIPMEIPRWTAERIAAMADSVQARS